jgi:hypothetical protein
MMSLQSRDILFGRKFYIVEVMEDPLRLEICNWAEDTFGPPENDSKGHRWFMTDGELWFHKQSDRDWLIMRWS